MGDPSNDKPAREPIKIDHGKKSPVGIQGMALALEIVDLPRLRRYGYDLVACSPEQLEAPTSTHQGGSVRPLPTIVSG